MADSNDSNAVVEKPQQEATPYADLPDDADRYDPSDNNQPAEDEQKALEDQEVTEEKVEEKPADDEPQGEADQQEGLDPELLARAKEFGFTDQELESFGTNEQLDRVVRVAEKQIMALGQPQDQQTRPDQQPVAPPAEKPTEEAPFELGKFELPEEQYDEGVINMGKAVRGLSDHVGTEVAQLRQQVKQMAEVFQAQAIQAETAWFDQQIAALGDDYVDVFGKGNFSDLDRNSVEFKNRQELHADVSRWANNYGQTGRPNRTPEQMFLSGLRAGRFGEKSSQQTRQKIVKQVKRGSGRLLARPAKGRGTDGLTPTQRATRAVEEQMRAAGKLGGVAEEFE